MKDHFQALAWNLAASLGSCAMGLAFACGLCALHTPAWLTAVAGTAVYVSVLLQTAK
jgi:hypothetical protein